MRALIIRAPWIDLILTGKKTWEMRSRGVSFRERIGLIRQGSKAVVGTALLTGCRAHITTADEFARTKRYHQIPDEDQADAIMKGWTVLIVLSDVRRLPGLVPYEHRNGQQDWVTLSDDVVERVCD